MAKSGPNKSRGEAAGLNGAGWFRNKKAKSRRKEQMSKASRKRNRGAAGLDLLPIILSIILLLIVLTCIIVVDRHHNQCMPAVLESKEPN